MGAIRKPRFLNSDVENAMEGLFNRLLDWGCKSSIDDTGRTQLATRIFVGNRAVILCLPEQQLF